jgi:hypothetical protein
MKESKGEDKCEVWFNNILLVVISFWIIGGEEIIKRHEGRDRSNWEAKGWTYPP